jgi:dienelactone hydrolase
MIRAHVVVLMALLYGAPASARDVPAARQVTISAPDGIKLSATYYPAGQAGPAVLLLHMCNTTRKSWEPLAPRLAAAGIHALSVDYRGFGDSGGPRAGDIAPQEAQRIVAETWPGDIDAAYAFLVAQPGVDRTRVGVAGGSCGVTQAVGAARRHADVRSLALLAGPIDAPGIGFMTTTPWIPIFAAAAADDQYDANAPESMRWVVALSGNPRNRFSGFKDGKHGTEIFGPHPELVQQMVDWYTDTLINRPASRQTDVAVKNTPVREFWAKAASPEGAADAVRIFNAVPQSSRRPEDFPEAQINLLGYFHLQAGRREAAIHLFKLNTSAYPTSANTYDSLGDAYLANGQNDLALQMSERALALLPQDPAPEDRKKAIRDSAEQKIAKLKGGTAKEQ